jgi:hypothetical protein
MLHTFLKLNDKQLLKTAAGDGEIEKSSITLLLVGITVTKQKPESFADSIPNKKSRFFTHFICSLYLYFRSNSVCFRVFDFNHSELVFKLYFLINPNQKQTV